MAYGDLGEENNQMFKTIGDHLDGPIVSEVPVTASCSWLYIMTDNYPKILRLCFVQKKINKSTF